METSRAAPAVQAQGKSAGAGEVSARPRSVTPALYGMRRSCDACGRKKRKCDGERPSCRRCLRIGQECVYSKRMCHQPVPQQQQHSTSGAVVRRDGVLPFKRCGLSPSPATGLVGMQENAFLSDFFACVGFLPLTTKSDIRETMVKIMLAPASRRQAAFGICDGVAVQPDADTIGNAFGGGKELPMNPSTCMFWCAVALGALVRGSPIESVASYAQLAADALEQSHSGPADTEVALAWAILAFLHNFTGNSARFLEYLQLSNSFLVACVERGSTGMLPVGFVEKVERGHLKPHDCDATTYAFFSQVPQLKTGADEHELFRHVMQSFQDFENDTFARLAEILFAVDPEKPGDAQAPPASEDLGGGLPADNTDFPPMDAVSEALASAWTEGRVAEFEHLDEALDRSGIGAGLAGVMVNGFLAFKAAGRGDVPGALERLARGVEVFERYPGLCRSVMGAHEAHELVAALGALEGPRAREMFDTLRGIYNPFRPRGMSPVPPREEWQGMSSLCNSFYCSAIGGVISNYRMKAFPRPADVVNADADHVGGYESDVGNLSFTGEFPEEFPGEFPGDFPGKFIACPEPLLTMPAESGEALLQGVGDHELSSPDWLDVTHAMLEAGDHSGPRLQ